MSKINPLKETLQKLSPLNGVSALLSWDQETMMPDAAIEERAKQSVAISTMIHDQWNHADFKDQLSQLCDLDSGVPNQGLSSEECSFVQEVHREWRQRCALPSKFVEAWSRATTQSQHAWQSARDASDFGVFAPHLKTLLGLCHDKIAYLGIPSGVRLRDCDILGSQVVSG